MKPKFNIGDYVGAIPSKLTYTKDKIGERFRFSYRRERIIKLATIRKGVIVGAVYRMKGQITPGDYEEGAYFTPSEGVLFWQIREGYLNKPFEALEEDIKLIERVHFHCIRLGNSKGKDIYNPIKIPWRKSGMTDGVRKMISKDMKQYFREYPEYFPRDSKGRFTK